MARLWACPKPCGALNTSLATACSLCHRPRPGQRNDEPKERSADPDAWRCEWLAPAGRCWLAGGFRAAGEHRYLCAWHSMTAHDHRVREDFDAFAEWVAGCAPYCADVSHWLPADLWRAVQGEGQLGAPSPCRWKGCRHAAALEPAAGPLSPRLRKAEADRIIAALARHADVTQTAPAELPA